MTNSPEKQMLSPSQKPVPQIVNSSQCSRKVLNSRQRTVPRGGSCASRVAGRWAGKQTLTRRNKRKLEEGVGCREQLIVQEAATMGY